MPGGGDEAEGLAETVVRGPRYADEAAALGAWTAGSGGDGGGEVLPATEVEVADAGVGVGGLDEGGAEALKQMFVDVVVDGGHEGASPEGPPIGGWSVRGRWVVSEVFRMEEGKQTGGRKVLGKKRPV